MSMTYFEEAKRAIAWAARNHPDVDHAGFPHVSFRKDPAQQAAFERESREALSTDKVAREVATALAWLDRCAIIKTPNLYSYALKHRAERWGEQNEMEPYVSNGSLIIAALYREVPMKRERGSLNCWFALNRRSLPQPTGV